MPAGPSFCPHSPYPAPELAALPKDGRAYPRSRLRAGEEGSGGPTGLRLFSPGFRVSGLPVRTSALTTRPVGRGREPRPLRAWAPIGASGAGGATGCQTSGRFCFWQKGGETNSVGTDVRLSGHGTYGGRPLCGGRGTRDLPSTTSCRWWARSLSTTLASTKGSPVAFLSSSNRDHSLRRVCCDVGPGCNRPGLIRVRNGAGPPREGCERS
jgi:hypothetical protein